MIVSKESIIFALKQDQAYQVTVSLTDEKTRKREITGLQEAMLAYNLPEGHIITMDEKETIQTDSGVIYVVPVWEWLLG